MGPLKSKQTSITTVRYPIVSVDRLPTLLIFRYPLPLNHKLNYCFIVYTARDRDPLHTLVLYIIISDNFRSYVICIIYVNRSTYMFLRQFSSKYADGTYQPKLQQPKNSASLPKYRTKTALHDKQESQFPVFRRCFCSKRNVQLYHLRISRDSPGFFVIS